MDNKVAIVTSGFLPVPATRGGAVENLLVNMLNENEKQKKEKFLIYSIFDDIALEESKKYKNSDFIFIKSPFFIKLLDKITHFIAKNILKKKNSQSYKYIFQRLFFLRKISNDLKINNYKKILLENHPTQYLCLKWNKNFEKYKGRYYYHCHNEFPSEYGCHDIILGTKYIICVSNYIRNTVSKNINMPIDKFSVLRNGIDIERFSNNCSIHYKEDFFSKHKILNKDKVLLFTGRFVPEKGVYELVEAIKKVKYENFKLLIIGSALNDLDTKTEYETLIENSLGAVANKVIFTGFIKYEEINKIYKIADIAIIPSIWDDPAPLTIIESLVSGLPIITTNSGGIPEYATEGSAIILERNDKLIDNLAIAIDDLLINDDKRNKMSQSGKKVSRDLSIEAYYNNFIELIR